LLKKKKKMIEEMMKRAIEMSRKGLHNGGGPFGALIVRDGEVISESHNTVTIGNDPTAHAEVNAIRLAATKLGKFDLSDCEIYTSCEPCPMCLSAIYWARIPKIYFGNTYHDAAEIGFSDKHIYQQLLLNRDERDLEYHQICHEEALEVFNEWEKKSDRVQY
jgi:tRNA(Arg) A34 adenosine deaminase TadA